MSSFFKDPRLLPLAGLGLLALASRKGSRARVSPRMIPRTLDSVSMDFVGHAARAFFAEAFASEAEERGYSFSQMDIHEIAPPTPPDAVERAKEWLYRIERQTGKTFLALWDEAVERDVNEGYGYPKLSDFGFYLAMQAMGHGVAWSDSHADFTFKVPHEESGWYFNPEDPEHVDWDDYSRYLRS